MTAINAKNAIHAHNTLAIQENPAIQQNIASENLALKFRLKIFLPAILGTILEYYDYALYGFFAATLAEHFFPANDPIVALMKTFGVFVAGSVSKPLGSFLFSIVGDSVGRKHALKYSLLGIAFPTLVIAFVPGYQAIGSLATAILLLCRIFQGFFVSGESDGVRVYLYEHFGKQYPCLINSLSGMACMLGIYLASLAAAFQELNLFQGNFRIFFLIGGSLGIVLAIFRKFLVETQPFLHEQAEHAGVLHHDSPIGEVLKTNKKTLLATICICGSAGGAYHFYLIFFPAYLQSILELCSKSWISFYNSQAVLVFSLSLPVFGFLADRLGKLTLIKLSSLFVFLMVLMNVWMIWQGFVEPWILLGTALALAPLHSMGFVFVYERLKVLERFRCSSLGHAIGSMLFSGTAPFISLCLWKFSNMQILPFFYFVFLLMMGYQGVYFATTIKKPA